MALLERLASRRLIVVTGKGGVGKTVVTAALGSLLSDLGRRTMLIEVDPRENLHQVFDVQPSGGERVDINPRLSIQNVQPRTVIEDLVRQHLRFEVVAKRVTASPVFEHFVEGAPGLKELAILSHAERLVRQHVGRRHEHFDLVVLDAPATGHGVALLTAPQLTSEVIERGPIGAEARQLATFVADAAKTTVVAVTLAEEMPTQETLELRSTLERRFGRGPELLVVNSLYPPFPAGATAEGDDALLLELWRMRRAVNEREVAHLAASWHGPMLEIPMLPADRGPRLLAGVRQQLLEQARQAA
jgi:anion-transporting  ArsA/GET3 family ATPase